MNMAKSILRATVVLAAGVVFLFPIFLHAAEFSADLHISGPQTNFLYKLLVTDTHYRLEKIKGPMTVPPFPHHCQPRYRRHLGDQPATETI